MTEEAKKTKLCEIIISMDEIIHDAKINTIEELELFDLSRLIKTFERKSQYLNSYFDIFYNESKEQF